jgi:hypothetical protein
MIRETRSGENHAKSLVMWPDLSAQNISLRCNALLGDWTILKKASRQNAIITEVFGFCRIIAPCNATNTDTALTERFNVTGANYPKIRR